MTAPTAPAPAPTPDPLGLHASAYAPAAPVIPPPADAAAQALAAKRAAEAAERDRLASRSVDITLRDGRVLGLRYGMAGVVALEETFGDLKAVGEAFGKLASGDGPVFTALLGLVGAGLAHHGLTRADLIRGDLLELTRLAEYGEAASVAFDRAFPAPSDAPGEGDGQTAA